MITLKDNEDDELNAGGIRYQKTGLGYYNQNTDREKRGEKLIIFRWLNEAVTEALSAEALGLGSEGGTYRDERLALDVSLNFGDEKSRALILDAYFENPEPGEGMPHWQELNRYSAKK